MGRLVACLAIAVASPKPSFPTLKAGQSSHYDTFHRRIPTPLQWQSGNVKCPSGAPMVKEPELCSCVCVFVKFWLSSLNLSIDECVYICTFLIYIFLKQTDSSCSFLLTMIRIETLVGSLLNFLLTFCRSEGRPVPFSSKIDFIWSHQKKKINLTMLSRYRTNLVSINFYFLKEFFFWPEEYF